MKQFLLALSLRFGAHTDRLGKLLANCENIASLHDNPSLVDEYLPPKRKKVVSTVSTWWRWLQQSEWDIVALNDAPYSSLLATISNPPGVLYVRGNVALLQQPAVAIVGARRASPEGLMHARQFSQPLTNLGLVVVSVLAYGIDRCAHEGALLSGRTIAVLPNGPDAMYPAAHKGLAEEIVRNGGLLITEFPPGISAMRPFFPQRNRIISGLSLATLVLECALPSGTLVTARLALEQGREVFAMPGAIHNPMSKGCHYLLRDGAHWLESVEDVLEQFPSFHALAQVEAAAPEEEQGVLKFFMSGVNYFDDLLERSAMTVEELNIALTELEIEGKVQRIAGGYGRC